MSKHTILSAAAAIAITTALAWGLPVQAQCFSTNTDMCETKGVAASTHDQVGTGQSTGASKADATCEGASATRTCSI